MPVSDSPAPKGALPILRALFAAIPIVVFGTLVGIGVLRLGARPSAPQTYASGAIPGVAAAFESDPAADGASHLSLTGVTEGGLRQQVTLSAATGSLDEIWASFDRAAETEGWKALVDRPRQSLGGGWQKTYIRNRELRIVQVGERQGDARPVSVFHGTFAGEATK